MGDKNVTVRLVQEENYRFGVHFDPGMPVLYTDEPAPLGTGLGPSPLQLLAAAVGNCLSDSLLFALRKFKQAPDPIQCEVTAVVGRNPEQRLRVLELRVRLQLGVEASALQHLDRVLEQFEAFCTVSQSVGQGIAIHTQVFDAHGDCLKT